MRAGTKRFDVIVVGGRCAGATLALALARAGVRALIVDRDPLGSDTLSTHVVFPNTVARLQELGVLERMADGHRLRGLAHRMRLLGREFAGEFTPVSGQSRCMCIRRPVLDRALAQAAIDAGAQATYGQAVTALIGAGTAEDPVRGVELASGERVHAPLVVGADGRASRLARGLALERTAPVSGDQAMLFSYWRGLPESEHLHFEIDDGAGLSWFPCEDDVDLLITLGDESHTRGGGAGRERTHLAALRGFPATLDPSWLESAERISGVLAAPETMLRGYFRQAAGPGWALVGDAGHFKHPASAQGISDAIEQALYLAALIAGEEGTAAYGPWRDARAEQHYEWSFVLGRFPRTGVSDPLVDGLRDDHEAAQDFRDTLTRAVAPAEVFSEARVRRWAAGAA